MEQIFSLQNKAFSMKSGVWRAMKQVYIYVCFQNTFSHVSQMLFWSYCLCFLKLFLTIWIILTPIMVRDFHCGLKKQLCENVVMIRKINSPFKTPFTAVEDKYLISRHIHTLDRTVIRETLRTVARDKSKKGGQKEEPGSRILFFFYNSNESKALKVRHTTF